MIAIAAKSLDNRMWSLSSFFKLRVESNRQFWGKVGPGGIKKVKGERIWGLTATWIQDMCCFLALKGQPALRHFIKLEPFWL